MLCNVQQKLSCVFDVVVVDQSSTKRSGQSYKVVAGRRLVDGALESGVADGLPTEKLDGTCCYVGEYNSRPWIWARHDVKPSKAGLKRHKGKSRRTAGSRDDTEGGGEGGSGSIPWDPEKDFKPRPDGWIPASGVRMVDGVAQPDDNGHIPGWVPVDVTSKQHCWHLAAVNADGGFGFVLQSPTDDRLEIVTRDLAELSGCTLELIGTHVNGNPYRLGSKRCPLHLLVRHGAIAVSSRPPLDRDQLVEWFKDDDQGSVEGIVWHCANGAMFKVHRHHLDLPWPIDKPRLCNLPVTVSISHQVDKPKGMYQHLYTLNNNTYASLAQLTELMETNADSCS